MNQENTQSGMTLIEVLISMVVTIVGVTAAANLILYGVTLQILSRDSSMATGLAKAKIEELRITPSTDSQLSVGGDLDSNVTDHFDAPTGFARRWLVAAGKADTLDVTVRVISENPTAKANASIDIRVLLEED